MSNKRTGTNDMHLNLKKIKTKEKKSSKETITSNHQNLDFYQENKNINTQKPKKPSKRQLKKEKARIRELQEKRSKIKEIAAKCLNYLSMWKFARQEWKFEKLKQVWLVENILNEDLIPSNQFPIVLEYFEASQGKVKKLLLDKCMAVIREIEEKVDDEDICKNIKYMRARELLQVLPI